MNLSENLKRIRKENNLSQEQLADKLGVSRQSVSKWESNLAYPEMDKVLQICKMFNLNIDELLNQDLKEVKDNKQRKNNVNKFIDDFLDYITKTIDMFSSMKLKEQIKCLLEQLVIIGVITLMLLIVGVIVKNIVSSILSFLPESLYYTLYNILINGVYMLLCMVLGVSLTLHIFKIRYLDYYVIVKEKKDEVVEESIQEKTNIKEEKKKRKFFSKPEREKIIIREPKHSGYKFISTMVKLILLLLKTIVIIIATFFCISLIMLFAILIISFVFVKTGIVFVGSFAILSSMIIINLIILNILYKFIIDQKRNTKRLSSLFLISLIIFGIGVGMFLIGIKDFKFIDSIDNSKYVKTEEIIKMQDNLYFTYLNDDDYIETTSDDVKIVFTYSKLQTHEIYINANGHIEIWFNNNDDFYFEKIKNYIEDINNKRIVNYYKYDVKLYTSKKNIEKLKQNKEKKHEYEYNNYVEKLNDQINNLEQINYDNHIKIKNMENQIEILKNELNIAKEHSCE